MIANVRLSVVIANYNGMTTLPTTLASLLAYSIELHEIIVVDDGSSDGSVAWLRRVHPDVRVIAFPVNTANLARVRNAGLQAATGTHVFLTDNDIELLPGCLEHLLEVILSDPQVFCVTPRLVYRDRPEVIFQDGNGMHFLALGTGNRRGLPLADAGSPAPFPTCGGGMMLFDAERLHDVGGFDEGYAHAWADDAELQFRGMLYGFKCLHVSTAVCTHEAKQHGTGRAYGQLHNRFRVLLTFYQARTLWLLLPSLLVFEAALFLAAIVHRFPEAYLRAVRDTWRERSNVLATRRLLQRKRAVADKRLFWGGAFEIPGVVPRGPLARAAIGVLEYFVNLNWRLVRWFG